MSVIYLYYDHHKKVEELKNKFKEALPPFCLKFKGHSNTTRPKKYNDNLPRLDISKFNKPIKIDLKNQTITVEPRITFKKLVNQTLKFGFTPSVVPEFMGITVGGAVLGGCAESSSFRNGLFSDTCTMYEILNGNGEVIRASPTENSDIFYAFSGSYGSLGTLLSVTLKLEKAKKFVSVTPNFFDDMELAINFINKCYQENSGLDFIDGIIFSPRHICILTASQIDKTSSNKFYTPTHPFSKWYFQYISEKSSPFIMTLENYFFRYDKAAFWMGSFLSYPKFIKDFLFQGILNFKKNPPNNNKFPIRAPGLFFRTLLSPFMKSQRLWQLLHKCENWINDCFVIQDFCIPSNRVSEFIKISNDHLNLFPLWLCPIKASQHKELFNPHGKINDHSNDLYINVGIYGQCKGLVKDSTILLEKNAFKMNGRKVLYASSFYTSEDFWQIYDREKYLEMRQKTFSNNKWLDIVDKVLS